MQRGERQLKDFSKFLRRHDEALLDLLYKSVVSYEFAIDNVSTARGASQSKRPSSLYQQLPPWSAKDNVITPMQQHVPIRLNFGQPVERISTLELVATDNQCLNKMIGVFVHLCTEVRQLMDDGDAILLKCLYADEDLCQFYCQDDELIEPFDSSGLDVDLGNLTPTAILKINKLLDFLCETQNFVEQCFLVISDIIKQLAALFAAEDQYYINVNYSSLHFQVNFNHTFKYL